MNRVKPLLLSVLLAACSGGESGGAEAPSPGTSSEPGAATSQSVDGTKSSSSGDLTKVMVDAHNHYRAAHCAPPLDWSADVARVAQAWANELAHSGCKLRHSKTNLGENLAAGTPGTIPPERAVELWYDENKSYDFGKATFTMGAGHFSQLVWKGSRHVGCGTATCGDKQIWVCNYDPAGNVLGDFASNVDRPTCKK
jgi:uncharacterized protein YkwD